jgi:hypothetical protein
LEGLGACACREGERGGSVCMLKCIKEGGCVGSY